MKFAIGGVLRIPSSRSPSRSVALCSVGELEVDIIVERICPFCLAFEALRRLVGTIRGTWMVAPIGIGSSRKSGSVFCKCDGRIVVGKAVMCDYWLCFKNVSELVVRESELVESKSELRLAGRDAL